MPSLLKSDGEGRHLVVEPRSHVPWHLHRDAPRCLQVVGVVVDVLRPSLWVDENSGYYLVVGFTVFDGLAVDDSVGLHEVRDLRDGESGGTKKAAKKFSFIDGHCMLRCSECVCFRVHPEDEMIGALCEWSAGTFCGGSARYEWIPRKYLHGVSTVRH
mgnify:CR=1 FL=1